MAFRGIFLGIVSELCRGVGDALGLWIRDVALRSEIVVIWDDGDR